MYSDEDKKKNIFNKAYSWKEKYATSKLYDEDRAREREHQNEREGLV